MNKIKDEDKKLLIRRIEAVFQIIILQFSIMQCGRLLILK